jgi:hypothetical protein
MDEELRNLIGETLYKAQMNDTDRYAFPWEKLSDEMWWNKETYKRQAEKVIQAYKGWIEKEESKLLTDKQRELIKLLLDDKCTDGYLMTKLGIFEWKDAQKLIDQYKREEQE